MNDSNRTIYNASELRKRLQQAIYDCRQDEKDNVEFREFCEGIYKACQGALGMITGESK